MVKQVMMVLSAAAAALFLGACASMQTAEDVGNQKISDSSSDKNVAHIYATNWGIYCFSAPVFTGSTEKPGDILFGKDTVNTQSVVKMLAKKSSDMGATKTLNLDTKHNSVWILPAFVLFYREVQVSGNAVK